MPIRINSLERLPNGEHAEVLIGDTRITADTRGQSDITIEDGQRVVRVTLANDDLIDDVDVIEPE